MTYQAKQKIIAAFVAAISLSTAPAFAENFQMAANGIVTDTTCSATVSKNSLDMGFVNKNSFASVGSTVVGDEFTVTVANCPGVMSKAKITIKGTADDVNSNLFAIKQIAGAAQGLGVQVKPGNSASIIAPNGSVDYPLTAGEANASFYVDYVSTKPKEDISAGTVNASFNVEVTYQ